MFHLGSFGLWEPDEARYAEIAREMLQSGNLLVPHLNYVAYVEKPPVLYWLTTLSFWIFGVSEFAARLPVALSAITGILATYFFALRAFGRRHAILAAAILATTPLYALMAQVLTTDMTLTAFVTIATFALYLHWQEGGRWCWIAYVAMGLAMMTKGPVGAALPILSMLIWLALNRELRGAIGKFRAVPGLLLTTADRGAVVCRDDDTRAGLRRLLLHRRASATLLRNRLQPQRSVLLLPSSARDRAAAVDVAGAVPHLARGCTQPGAEFLPRRGDCHGGRFLMREREADSVHPAGGSSAGGADCRRTRLMRMAGCGLACRAQTAGLADSHRERTDACAVGCRRDHRGNSSAEVSHSLCDGCEAGDVRDRRDPAGGRRESRC